MNREDIAEALSTIDGVTGYEYRPSVIKSGDAWAKLDSLEREQTWFEATWSVFIVLPQDEKQASIRFEALVPEVDEALGFIDRIQQVTLESDSREIMAMAITLRSEF